MMRYNNVTNTLRAWCNDMTQQYYEQYKRDCAVNGQSPHDLSQNVTAELSYKLGTLIDREYPSYEAYRQAVLDLIPVHIDFALKKDLGKIERYYVCKVEDAFCEYLDCLSPDCPSPNVPYSRVIWGEEADAIAERYDEVWKYDTDYWYPLNGMWGEDKLFIAPQYLEPYRNEIAQLMGLPEQHIYAYGEAWYDCPHCLEVDAVADWFDSEIAYCPKDFSWIMYFSHENTVAFAGSIVSPVKEILHAEREHWNIFQWIGEP